MFLNRIFIFSPALHTCIIVFSFSFNWTFMSVDKNNSQYLKMESNFMWWNVWSDMWCTRPHMFPGFEVGTSAQKAARRRVEILSDQLPHCRTAYVKAPNTVATSTAWCILPCTFWHLLLLLLLPWGVSLPPVPVTCPIFMTNVTVAGNPHKTMSSDWKTILFLWLS